MFRTQSQAHWIDRLQTARIPCAPVNDFAQALVETQVQARNMVVAVAHPSGDTVQMPGNPTSCRIRTRTAMRHRHCWGNIRMKFCGSWARVKRKSAECDQPASYKPVGDSVPHSPHNDTSITATEQNPVCQTELRSVRRHGTTCNTALMLPSWLTTSRRQTRSARSNGETGR